MAFKVVGGVYTSTSFKILADIHPTLGPFEEYSQALTAWKNAVWANVDNALHRMTIVETTVDTDNSGARF